MPLFAVVGISEPTALHLMPLVGISDVLAGVLVLLHPCRALLVYMTAWSLWTALLRPLSGQPIWELLERSANFGVPLALLLLVPPARRGRDLIERIDFRDVAVPAWPRAGVVLRATTVALLAGHAAFGLVMGKASLVTQVQRAGIAPAGMEAASALQLVGGVDLLLALLVLARPTSSLLVAVAAWKMATEALYPLSGDMAWEWVERGASFGAPLVLAMILTRRGEAARAAGPPSPLRPPQGS